MADLNLQQTMLAAVVHEAVGGVKLFPITKVVEMPANAGGKIEVPVIEYIGNAEAVGAGQAISAVNFAGENQQADVIKGAKAIAITQEDINNAFIDVQEMAEQQLGKAIADKVEMDLHAALQTATMTANITELDGDNLPDALVPFGDNLDEKMYVVVSPQGLAALRKDPNFLMNANHTGNVNHAGYIFDMEVIVSSKVETDELFIVKEGALALYMKAETQIEVDKDILKQTYNVVATQHYAAVLNDASKAIKVTIGADADAGEEAGNDA